MREIDERYFDKNNIIKKNTIEDCLIKGEKILWRGKPKKLSYVLYKCIKFIPIALLWGAIDVSVIIMMVSSSDISSILYFIIPFFAIHLFPVWLCIASLIKAHHEIKNTAYAITNKRIIAKSGLYAERFIAISFEEISDIQLKKSLIDKMLKCGDIYITAKSSAVILFDIIDSEFIHERIKGIIDDPSFKKDEFYDDYTVCEHCGSYIKNEMKKCPNCGALNKGFNPNK